MEAAAERYTAEVRTWIGGGEPHTPGLRALLDSFVRRGDQDSCRQPDRAFRRAGIPAGQALPVWRQLAALYPASRRELFAARVAGGLQHAVRSISPNCKARTASCSAASASASISTRKPPM